MILTKLSLFSSGLLGPGPPDGKTLVCIPSQPVLIFPLNEIKTGVWREFSMNIFMFFHCQGFLSKEFWHMG